jgi:hypothetical protein
MLPAWLPEQLRITTTVEHRCIVRTGPTHGRASRRTVPFARLRQRSNTLNPQGSPSLCLEVLMDIDIDVIPQAFELNDEIYVKEMGWPVRDIAEIWEWGHRAYAGAGDEAASNKLYEILKNKWQVFRGKSKAPAPGYVYELMMGLARNCAPIRDISLSKLRPEHLPQLRKVLMKASTIKTNKSGPSLMAASKFLHCWNPRLFVIVDGYVMESHVLRHHWVAREIKSALGAFTQAPSVASGPEILRTEGGLPYLAVLLWGSEVMKKNPSILATFTERLKKALSSDSDPRGYEDFEGAAFEWFLRGLVELPPAGIRPT